MRRKRADGRDSWRARWTDPDSGRTVWQTLDTPDLGLTRAEERTAWAIDKAEALRDRRRAIERGEGNITPTTFDAALDTYRASRAAELRTRSLDLVDEVIAHLRAWCPPAVKTTADLTPARLASFRDYVVALSKTTAARGPGRGRRKGTRKPLAAPTRNKILRGAATLVRDLERRGLLEIDERRIKTALRPVRVTVDVPDYLSSMEIRELLGSAMRHDRETFIETREEHAGKREPGTTPRYPASAPILLVALLTGMRRGEIEGLRWREVDLRNEQIVLPAERVKIGRGRVVDMSISPSLVKLLKRLKARSTTAAVFPDYAGATSVLDKLRRRLVKRFGSPEFSLQKIRRTTSTFVSSTPKLGPWTSARRCGHGVQLAEARYAGLVRVDPNAETIEQSMNIEDVAERIVEAAGGRRGVRASA